LEHSVLTGARRARSSSRKLELEDAGSADILTGISRGVDKWLWFVEARE
jgi:DNA-binding ferritin-like protein